MLALITSILHFECAIVGLLVMPILSLDQWQRILHSEYVKSVYKNLKPWIYIYILLVASFLLNSLRLMNDSIDAEIFKDEKKLLQYSINQAIAQRNFHISGASIFLLALSRQLVIMKLTQAEEIVQDLNIDGYGSEIERSELQDTATVESMDDQSTMNISEETILEEPIVPIFDDLETNINPKAKTGAEDMNAKAKFVMGVFYERSGKNEN